MTYVVAFVAAVAFIFIPSDSWAPTYEFDISLPTGTNVTMGTTSATLPFRVTNSASSTTDIRAVEFAFDSTVYNIDEATNPPTGWSIKGSTAATICMSTGTGIANDGSSEIFDIVLTGPLGGLIKSATDDATDTLDTVNVTAKDAATCGSQFTLNSGPSWTRKSIETSLSAAPTSVGTGDTITVTSLVTNRSTGAEANIDIPTAEPYAFVYGVTSTTADIAVGATTIPVASTSGFPSSGTIKIDGEEITYSSITSTTFTVTATTSFHANGYTVYSRTSDGGSYVTSNSDQSPANVTLTTGSQDVITWTYNAAGAGSVYFSTSLQDDNGTGPDSSKDAYSDQVVIGDFTAVVDVTPLAVISSQDVTVTMVVTNNGNSAKGNVAPETLTAGGTATATYVSGPSPASVVSLPKDKSQTFTWVYTISGNAGDTYYFYGNGTDGDANDTNTSTSASGVITAYSATIDPDNIASAGTADFDWVLYNNGGESVKEVVIPIPAGWSCASAAATGWTAVCDNGAMTLTYSAGTNIPVGGSKLFEANLTAPTINADTSYTFPLTITDQKNNNASVDTEVLVTAYEIVITYEVTDTGHANYPVGPIEADGIATYTLLAELTGSATDVVVTFTATDGTLTATQATTTYNAGTGNRDATTSLTAPCSNANVTGVTIGASYLNAADTLDINSGGTAFSAVAVGTLTYVGSSLTPSAVNSGDSVALALTLLNCGSNEIDITWAELDFQGEVFSFTPSSSNPSTYNPIAASDTGTFTFDTKTISSADIKCQPELTVAGKDDPSGANTDYAGPFDTSTAIDDFLAVDGATLCVQYPGDVDILDWRELY